MLRMKSETEKAMTTANETLKQLRPAALNELPWRAAHPDAALRLPLPTVRPVKSTCEGRTSREARFQIESLTAQTHPIYRYAGADQAGEKLEKALHATLVVVCAALIVNAALVFGKLLDGWPSFMALVRNVVS